MGNYVNPDSDDFKAFRENRRAGPIHMLNLIKLRDQAVYEDRRKVSGAEAYRIYGAQSGPIFRALGGQIIWSGRPENMLIGPREGEDWDIAFIAQYPDMDAFITMMRDPAYQAVTHHRTAAVENSRLIRLQPMAAGAGFGE